MADVRSVANFFIDLALNSEDDNITNLQLNKLLYFAQGHYLARTGKPLFDEEIEAWKFGPVVPSIYQAYKGCGKMPITVLDEDYDADAFSDEEMNLLMEVACKYGQYSASALVGLTHRPDTPWSRVYSPLAKNIVKQQDIKDYFSQEDQRLETFDALLERSRIPTVTKLPADWYDPSEDEEWEAYQ